MNQGKAIASLPVGRVDEFCESRALGLAQLRGALVEDKGREGWTIGYIKIVPSL